jgi:DivIVA domain-containing protein
MVDFSPDAIADRSFRTSLRGFDRSEVRDFLAGLGEAIAELAAERDRLAAQLQAGDAEDLRQEIEVVSKEIHSVLEAARSAAESMRERAAAETARWRSEAIAEAEKTRREAQVDAEHLRTDAWTTAEALLSQIQREADRMRGEADKESMRLLGEAEREAHRTLGAARRESEETLRTARMEAEKLVLDARASHDEIIETAAKKAEIAQERTRALEERRDELRRELDAVRSAIAAVESELDERREALGLTAGPPAAPEREPTEEWVPGETVRVVRPGHSEPRTDEFPVVSEARPKPDATPELRVLSAEELRARQHHPSQAPSVEEPAHEDEVEETPAAGDAVAEPEQHPVTERQVDEAPQPAAAEPEPTTVAQVPDEDPQNEPHTRGQSVDELENLFARLRDPVADATDEETLTPPAENVTSPSEPTRRSVATLDADPFEVRDELLLPVTNRALRNLKRQLTEEQNAALEAIRLDETGWAPDVKTLQAGLRAELVVLAAESFAAGHAAAERFVGRKLIRPSTPRTELAPEFARALADDLAHALADGRAHDHASRQLGADVSRVFRAWRADESERRLRHHAWVAFHRGLHETLTSEGDVELRWILSGRGCAVCRDRADRSTLDELPPAHEGCDCTVVPT